MKKEVDLEGVRKIILEEYCKRNEMNLKEVLERRRMFVHKSHCMTGYTSLGYLFFALEGSPPKGYAVFTLGSPYNPETGKVSGSLIFDTNKTIRLTINGLDKIRDNVIVSAEGIQDL